jgi:hypothetical protein
MGNFIFFINFLKIEIYTIISYIFNFVNCFIQQLLARISHNVPAVYDVFAVAIKEREAFQQPQKCGWSVAWEWSAAE